MYNFERFAKYLLSKWEPELKTENGVGFSVWTVETLIKFAYVAGRSHERAAHLLGRRVTLYTQENKK